MLQVRLHLRTLAFLSVAMAAAPRAHALVAIDFTLPHEGSIGTRITILGAGFGAAKPQVSLSKERVEGKLAMKVLSLSDTEIAAEVQRAVAGTFDVGVKVK